MSIWASILGFDPSCRQELVRDKMQGYFIQYLQAKEKDMPSAQRCMAAFVLAEICNGFKDGQHSCLSQGLHRTCTSILRSFIDATSTSTSISGIGTGSGTGSLNAMIGGGTGTGVGTGGGNGTAVGPGVLSTAQSARIIPASSAPSLSDSHDSNSNCKLWVALCLFKLCEDFPYAKYLIFTEVTPIRSFTLMYPIADSFCILAPVSHGHSLLLGVMLPIPL